MEWCRENCTGGWHLGVGELSNDDTQFLGIENSTVDYSSVYLFHFEDERDYIAFGLKYL
jgi:hypothetical protein